MGSSAKMIAGRAARARATATRCCWPPDSSLGRCLSRSPSPTVVTTLSTQAGSGFRPARSIGSVMFSAAFRVGIRLKLWKTKPTWSRRTWVRSLSLSVVRSVSPMKTWPEVSESSPATQCMSVDLPDPDGPMIAVKTPVPKSMDDVVEGAHLGVARAVDLGGVQRAGRRDAARGRSRGGHRHASDRTRDRAPPHMRVLPEVTRVTPTGFRTRGLGTRPGRFGRGDLPQLSC